MCSFFNEGDMCSFFYEIKNHEPVTLSNTADLPFK